MPWLKPTLPVLLLAVITVLPGCACGSSSLLAGLLTKRAHCADIGSLSLQSLKLPFIIGNKKACFSALNTPATTTIIQKLPFILSLLWQEASGVSDIFTLLTRVRPTLNGKKNSLSPEKVFLPLTQDLVTDDDRASLEKQFRELMENQQQLTEEHKNRSSIYIALINQGLKVVVVPGQVIPERLFNTISHWLLDAELALYQQILPEADWLDLQPELEAIAAVSPASAAAGDDGDPDQEPDNDPEPALFIAGEFGVQPWIAGLYSQAVLQKQKLLGILRQRVRQAIASGNHDLARILLNRIMVIVADLSDLENAESQVSGNPALQALLLKGLLENSGEVQAYVTTNLAVEVPVDPQKENTSGGGSAESQSEPSTKEPLSGSDSKQGSSQYSSDSSDDNPGPEQPKHTYNKHPCPVCRELVCKETEPVPAKDLSIRPCYILGLPTGVLMRIFEYTPLSQRCAIMQCCSRFEQVSRDKKVLRSQVLVQLQGKLPDIVFPMGAAMFAALEAKVGFPLNDPPLKQALACYLKLAPSVCTHTLRVPCADFSDPDPIQSLATFADNRIVSGSLEGVIKVWSIKEGGRGLCTHTLRGHKRLVRLTATISDCWVISCSSRAIKIWNLNKPDINYCAETLPTGDRRVSCIETLQDMWFYLAIDEPYNAIEVWYLTEAGKAHYKKSLPILDKVTCLKALPEGQLFAGTYHGKISFWKTTKTDDTPPAIIWQAYQSGLLRGIEVLPEDRLLTCSCFYKIREWNLKNPDMPCLTYSVRLKIRCSDVLCYKLTPEGQMVVCTKSNHIKVFTFSTFRKGKLNFVRTANALTRQARMAILPGGQLVTGSYGGVIRVWDYTDTRHADPP